MRTVLGGLFLAFVYFVWRIEMTRVQIAKFREDLKAHVRDMK